MTSERLTNIIEAILYVSGNPVAVSDIAQHLGVTSRQVKAAAEELQKKYTSPCGLTLHIFNDKLQFGSNSEYAEEVSSVLNPIKERELSKSMLETAAIIAYKQPVTRLDLEEIRGNSEYAIQKLVEIGVIEVVGRKDAVGRPVLFGTTDKFLRRFKLKSLDELPDYEVLMARIKQINGTDNADNYLYRKDEYVEGQDDNSSREIDFSNLPPRGGEDFSLGKISDEELPDFLSDEDVDIIE